MYVYYPSCNFQAQFPQTAKAIRAYLQTQEDVKIAGCCHVTNQLPTSDDVIVTICMSCMRGLSETRPDVQNISFFEFLLTRNDFEWPDLCGRRMTLQDCFRARGKHALQDAVRECLRKSHIDYVEMPHNRDEESFDGRFMLRYPSAQISKEAPRYFTEYLPEHLTITPESEWDTVFKAHAKSYPTEKVVCYCNTCTSGAQRGGADAKHLASLLFETEEA